MNIKGVQYVVVLTIVSSVSGYPYDINVTDIKDTSAICRWKTTELTVEEFLIQCVGTQYYAVARDGRVHNTEMHVRSQFVPEGLKHVRIGDLRPNYNYTCVIEETLPEGAQVMNGLLSNPFTFTSDYANPVAPKAPVIVKEDGTTEIILYKSSNSKFGPIKGYAIQFHIFEGSFLGDIPKIEKDFTNPFGKFSPVTVEYAQTSAKALSFQIAYIGNSLPASILIGNDLLNGALKNGFLYRVIVVAYTERRDGSITFTPSLPSDTFMPVGVNKFISQGQFLNDVKAEQLHIGIAAGILIPLICLVYMTCIGVLLLCREKRQASSFQQPMKKSFLSKAWDKMKNGVSKSWLTCLTLCFDILTCSKCCRRKKLTIRDPKGGAKYHRVHSHEYPASKFLSPKQQNQYLSLRQQGYAPPTPQGYPSPMQQGYLPLNQHRYPSPIQQGYLSPMQQGYLSLKQHRYPSSREQSPSSPRQQSLSPGKQSPSPGKQSPSPKKRTYTDVPHKKKGHSSPRRAHTDVPQSSPRRHTRRDVAHVQQGPDTDIPPMQGYPFPNYMYTDIPHRDVQGYPSPNHMYTDLAHMHQGPGYMYTDTPMYGYPYNMPQNFSPPAQPQRAIVPESESGSSTSRSMYSKAPLIDSKSNLAVPFISRKIKMPTFSGPPRIGRHSPYYTHDQLQTSLSQLSPRFEHTSDTHPLQYTTSATGVFNTAEEFCSTNDQVYGSPSIHVNTSLSVSSYQPSKVPASGYERISLSSSRSEEPDSDEFQIETFI